MVDLDENLTPQDDDAQNAVEMLKADHRTVRTLFQNYQSAKEQTTKQRIAEQIFVELEVHAQLEELVFYPAFEAAADEEGKQLVEDARQEHQTVKDLIAELRDMDANDEDFDAQFQELMDNVEHHVQEEETEMFPEAEEVLAGDSTDLIDEMQEIKQQLLAGT
jgi:hemerythrin superfamily protein